jgi:hypothetical protein
MIHWYLLPALTFPTPSRWITTRAVRSHAHQRRSLRTPLILSLRLTLRFALLSSVRTLLLIVHFETSSQKLNLGERPNLDVLRDAMDREKDAKKKREENPDADKSFWAKYVFSFPYQRIHWIRELTARDSGIIFSLDWWCIQSPILCLKWPYLLPLAVEVQEAALVAENWTLHTSMSNWLPSWILRH